MFRPSEGKLEFLLVHPGGPFFRNKDDGAWTIPKGEAAPDEDLLSRAKIEFEEELGIVPGGPLIDVGTVKQKGGKTVYAWAFAGDLAPGFELTSNKFEIEWPPKSGRKQQFPEVDQAKFFPLELARIKINPAQIPFLERLRDALEHNKKPSK
jgi:predicted NUDIX family NTP pyrophosphohydrolase